MTSYKKLPGGHPCPHGFTLVELIVVVTILGLASSLVAIRLAGPLQRARAENAAQSVLNADHYARTLASSRDLRLIVDSTQKPLTLRLVDASGDLVKTWSMASTTKLTCESLDSKTLAVIHYPQHGGTIDFRARIQDGTSKLSLFVAGGTGHVHQSWD
jgi:prepilin-type N-terminal cleavage/methylation domain-containing protein